MTKLESQIIEILKNPSRKKVTCSRCHGSGIVNRSGMNLSDTCPDCIRENSRFLASRHCGATGKVWAYDYEKTAKQIIELITGQGFKKSALARIGKDEGWTSR